MLPRSGTIWLLAGTLAAAPLVLDPGDYSVQLGDPGNGDGPTTLSVGSVGSRAGASYVPAQGNDPFHFNIPSERTVPDGGGLLLHIPLGNVTVR